MKPQQQTLPKWIKISLAPSKVHLWLLILRISAARTRMLDLKFLCFINQNFLCLLSCPSLPSPSKMREQSEQKTAVLSVQVGNSSIVTKHQYCFLVKKYFCASQSTKYKFPPCSRHMSGVMNLVLTVYFGQVGLTFSFGKSEAMSHHPLTLIPVFLALSSRQKTSPARDYFFDPSARCRIPGVSPFALQSNRVHPHIDLRKFSHD